MALNLTYPTAEAFSAKGLKPGEVGSGTADAPGGEDAPELTSYEMTQGQETYPGVRSGGEDDKMSAKAVSGANTSNPEAESHKSGQTVSQSNNRQTGDETGLNGDTPAAGDVDPDSTRSAEETGQDGDPTDRKKSIAHPYSS